MGTAALKQERTDKLTPTFRPGHFYVLYKTGNSVLDLVESLKDVQYKKNSSHVKNFMERNGLAEDQELTRPPVWSSDHVSSHFRQRMIQRRSYSSGL